MELRIFNFPDFSPSFQENRLRAIYEEAFPQSERRSWQSIRELAAYGRLDAMAVTHEGDAVGLVTIWKFPAPGTGAWIYIEHLALAPELRGRGLGTAVMEEIKRLYGLPIVLEAEPAGSTPQAHARLRFYKRLGFEVHDTFPYIQPPYAPGLPSVMLNLLTFNLPQEVSLSEIASTLHREVYGMDS